MINNMQPRFHHHSYHILLPLETHRSQTPFLMAKFWMQTAFAERYHPWITELDLKEFEIRSLDSGELSSFSFILGFRDHGFASEFSQYYHICCPSQRHFLMQLTRPRQHLESRKTQGHFQQESCFWLNCRSSLLC